MCLMIGSIGSTTVSTTVDAQRGETTAGAGGRTIAEHVAATDEREPIRSASSTQGTLVDTYL
jgi:hypothetical protein